MSTSKTNTIHNLEDVQYNVLYKINDAPLTDLREQHKTSILWICAGVFALALLLSCTLTIPNYVTIPIVIEHQGEASEMSFSHDVRVLKNYVDLGDTIAVDDPLCFITSPEIKSLINQIAKATHELQSLIQLDSIQFQSKLLGLQQEQTSKYALVNAIQQERTAAVATFKSEQQALQASIEYRAILLQKNDTLYRKGVISQVEFLTVKRNYEQLLAQRDILVKAHTQQMQSYQLQIEQINADLVPIRNQQTATTLNYEVRAKKLQQAIEMAKNELQLHYGSAEIDVNGLILRAQKDGVLTYHSPAQSRLLHGNILYRVEYSKANLLAKGFLNSDVIGQVKATMIGKINFESLPAYQWGTLQGNIHSISLSTDTKGRFAFTAAIQNTNPAIYERLHNGQSGTMSVIVDAKTLIGYLTASFQKQTRTL